MQHPVDPETHDPQVASRFDMDVRSPLIEGVLPQPVNDMNNMLIVRIELSITFPKLNQLLKIGNA